MHKGIRPGGQARTLRTIAEDQNNSSAFLPDPPMTPNEDTTEYHDEAEMLKMMSPSRRVMNAAEKSPFQRMRGGR